jgi:hypothetical protein
MDSRLPSKPIKPENLHIQTLLAQIGFTCPSGVNGIRFPDQRLCNMFFLCTQSGLPEPSLCPEGYLFSEISRDCEQAAHVNCGSRLSTFYDMENVNIHNDVNQPVTTTTTTTTITRTSTTSQHVTSSIVFSRSKTVFVNGTVECVLGADGYYEDPLYCNVYHHCLAGIDYIEHCPNQLAWNEKKKMCDW